MMMSIDWSKPISTLAYDPEDLYVYPDIISEENGFVQIVISYSAHPCGFSSADFSDSYCVDYLTGEPLNAFMSKDFIIINHES